jgi:PilZ domain/SPOR domain
MRDSHLPNGDMVEERRQHARLIPNSPLFVSLDDFKSGLLLDLSEGGLAVASLVPRNLDEVISVAFDLPEGRGRIETRSQIAWTRDSGHLTGVRFVDLDDPSRQQLEEWICARVDQRQQAMSKEPAGPVLVSSADAPADSTAQQNQDQAEVDTEVSVTSLEPTDEPRVEESALLSEKLWSRFGKSRHTIGPVFAVVLLAWALVYLGYQMGGGGINNRDAAAVPKGEQAASQGLVASAAASPAPVGPVAPQVSLGDGAVVLQVGAMKLEDNADALARVLQKKNFPAFVFRHGTDRLFRVAVGPYSDAKSTIKPKGTLEKQGFKPLLRRWLPE